MYRNKYGGVKDRGQPRGMWAHMDENSTETPRDRRSTAKQGCCEESSAPFAVVVPFTEK